MDNSNSQITKEILYFLIDLKFKVYSINFNLRSLLFKDYSYIIKPDYIVLIDGKNKKYEMLSDIVMAAKNKLVNLFKNLDEGDDLFNYLSFLNSDLIKEGEEFVHLFNENNNHDKLKSILTQESVFKNFVLYEYQIILYPIEGDYSEQEKEKINLEINQRVSFVNNYDLYEICCINKNLFNQESDKELKIEKCFVYILHEIVHLMLHEKMRKFNLPEYKSPIIKELTYTLNQQTKDSGDMLEFMMAVSYI